MNDTVGKTASSLALVEKKPQAQRPGGCVGIFFQLFDWNRRFAKKKLFSKKLLPPVRFKQASKKFGGDEKQPKIRLIADENSGGFPTAKSSNGGKHVDNEQRHEKRVPSLVARLMGLESMPALQRDKSKKAQAVFGKPEKVVNSKEEMNVEKGGIKHESRPQKLQKTSVCEKHSMTRFGAEKLPLKNVLSKPRKHPAKLPSPVKTPRNLSRKRSSRLIGAATRILEPGLHTSRSKCALGYSTTLQHPPQEADMDEGVHFLSNQMEDSCGFGGAAVKGLSPCRNCGYLIDDSNSNSTMRVQPLVFTSPFSNCVGSGCLERSKPGHSAICQELEEEFRQDYSAAGSFIANAQSYTGQYQQHLGSQQCRPPKGVPVSPSSNYKPQRQSQMFRARETFPSRPNLNSMTSSRVSTTTVINGTKNLVSADQSISDTSNRPRVATRMDNGRFELEKRITNDPVLPGRKRRPTNICRQVENSGFTMPGKQVGYDAHLINHQQGRTVLIQQQDRSFSSGNRNNNVAPFKYSLPVKQTSGIYEATERRVKNGSCCDESLPKSALGEKSIKADFEKPCPISGDALGALLEQKLNELNCQGEDSGNAPKKTTATILQELISALTLEVPFQQGNIRDLSDETNGWFNRSHSSNSTFYNHSQANAMHMKLPVDQPFDSEHPSPGSVLETQFSTESCPSSSVDDSLGYRMINESQGCSDFAPNFDLDLFDSAALLKTAESSKKLAIDILSNVSETIRRSNLDFCLKGTKLDEAKEVLLNAELESHNASLSGSVIGRGSPIKHLLLDELETFARFLWMDFGCCLGIKDVKEVNQLRTFALDSIIEYLGLRFQGYPNTGSKIARKWPLHLNYNSLIVEIVEAVRRWDELSGFGLDELIEREMSRSLREWTKCESEALETGMEISRHLYQILVDEIVIDLWNSS